MAVVILVLDDGAGKLRVDILTSPLRDLKPPLLCLIEFAFIFKWKMARSCTD